MQLLDKSKNNKVHRYCCSNPNCKKVFSKPKIIKYYVCPTCQTIVDLTLANFQSLPREKPVPVRKQVTSQKQKESAQDTNQEPKTITSSNELVSSEKPKVKEVFETLKPAQSEEPNKAEITSNKKSSMMGSNYETPFGVRLGDEHLETVKEQTGQSSDGQCKFFFGYLSQRSKEDVIPEICFGCLKSIECMLSECNKSPESVKEIKKWYSLKF